MDYVFAILAVIMAVVGVIGCIVPVLPGVALTWVGLLLVRLCDGTTVTNTQLFLWLGITIAVSVADYLLPGWMVRRFGGSRAGSTGATIGVFAGMFFGIIGLLAGPFIGAVAGEYLNDSRDFGRAVRVGMGSFAAFLAGTGLKLIAALWMTVRIILDLWPIFIA